MALAALVNALRLHRLIVFQLAGSLHKLLYKNNLRPGSFKNWTFQSFCSRAPVSYGDTTNTTIELMYCSTDSATSLSHCAIIFEGKE